MGLKHLSLFMTFFLSGNIPEYLLEKSLEESEKDFLSIAVSECVEVVLRDEESNGKILLTFAELICMLNIGFSSSKVHRTFDAIIENCYIPEHLQCKTFLQRKSCFTRKFKKTFHIFA